MNPEVQNESHFSYAFGPYLLALHFLGIKKNEKLMWDIFPNSLLQFDDWSISNFYVMQILQIVLLSFITFLSHLNIIVIWFFKDVLLFGKASWYLSNFFLNFLVMLFIDYFLYYVFTWIPYTEAQKLTLFSIHLHHFFH